VESEKQARHDGPDPFRGGANVPPAARFAAARARIGSRNDITVVRVVGRFGFAFLYQASVARIKDVPLAARHEGANPGAKKVA
jgi:hypothetical protein